jgi:hypothetical protein
LKLSTLILFAFVALPLAGATLTVNSLGDAGIGSGSSGDLRYVIAQAASGDSIAFSVLGMIALTSPLSISKDLTIIGSGIAINGSTSGTIFDLTGAVSDLFSGLTLLNATNAITGSSNSSITLLDSTISGSDGGIVGINGTVANSTFSGNGFAINGGTVSLYDSTISGGTFGTDNANLTIGNSIIYGNGTDVGSGTVVTDLGHNVIGGGGGFTNGVNGDIVGTNPNLGPLANNGGPTLTYALQAGSAAIDGGYNAIIPSGVTTDQRGPGFDRISGGTVDIGAFEYQQTPEPSTYATCLLGFAIGGFAIRARRLRKR